MRETMLAVIGPPTVFMRVLSREVHEVAGTEVSHNERGVTASPKMM